MSGAAAAPGPDRPPTGAHNVQFQGGAGAQNIPFQGGAGAQNIPFQGGAGPTSPHHGQPLRQQAIMSAAHLARSQPALPTYRQASVENSSQFRSVQGVSFPPAAAPVSARSSTDTPPFSLDSSLPDILHSHMLPQIPPARPNQHRHQRNNRGRNSRNLDHPNPSNPPNNNDSNNNNDNRDNRRGGGARGGRGHGNHGDRSHRHRHRRRSRTQSSSSTQTEGTCKEPCVKCVVTVTSFRWVLVVLSVVGVCCVVTGIVLAALHAAGKSFLFLAIMFVGESFHNMSLAVFIFFSLTIFSWYWTSISAF